MVNKSKTEICVNCGKKIYENKKKLFHLNPKDNNSCRRPRI